MDNNPESEENEEFEFLTKELRIIITIVSSIISIIVILLIIMPFYSPQEKMEDVGLAPIAIFSLAVLLIVNLPLEKLGQIFSNIGPFVFNQKLETQKKEQFESIVHLEKQIYELQETVQDLLKQAVLSEAGKANLEKIDRDLKSAEKSAVKSDSDAADLLEFLEKMRPRVFNASRIKRLASNESPPKPFSRLSNTGIYGLLHKLLAESKIRTRISNRTGSTLYGA